MYTLQHFSNISPTFLQQFSNMLCLHYRNILTTCWKIVGKKSRKWWILLITWPQFSVTWSVWCWKNVGKLLWTCFFLFTLTKIFPTSSNMLENCCKKLPWQLFSNNFTTSFQLFSNNQQLCSHWQHFSNIGVGTINVGKMLQKCCSVYTP